MVQEDQDVDRLSRERSEIVKSSRLHWFHWAVVVLSLVVTFGAWYFASTQVEEKLARQFDRDAAQFIELVSERMQKYEEGLWGGVSSLQSNGGAVSLTRWRTFAESLQLGQRYPGINGIGVIHQIKPVALGSYLAEQRRERPEFRIFPQHSRAVRLPITFIEPQGPNARAVGLDVAHETNRYMAALQARDSGMAQITGPIVLVQDNTKTPGFLFYAPFYSGLQHKTVEERRASFIGLVYAPFVFHKLIEGTLAMEKRPLRVSVRDGGQLLYDEQSFDVQQGQAEHPLSKQVELELYGRVWQFEIWPTAAFLARHESDQPILILVGGILIDGLLLCLFVLLTRANSRALQFVDRTTQALRGQTAALKQSNDELESFAYVASHDLKAPLRGISNLADWIVEDIKSGAANDVDQHVEKLQGRVRRMEDLLNGLLQYSRAGRDNAEVHDIELETELAELFALLEPPSGIRLSLSPGLPLLRTPRAPLEQVFRNLFSNALKHHDGTQGVVTVSARDLGSSYEFAVQDDGPGIPPEFHEKIFKIFQTLRRRDEVEGSGIGLSIVKRIVSSAGGGVSVDSDPGQGRGTTFRFTWPKRWLEEPELDMVG